MSKAPSEDGPLLVQPYAGQNQTAQIAVPATIAYKSYQYSPEEGPWVMIPYASLYPQPAQPTAAPVPPPIKKIDIFSAMQTWPL